MFQVTEITRSYRGGRSSSRVVRLLIELQKIYLHSFIEVSGSSSQHEDAQSIHAGWDTSKMQEIIGYSHAQTIYSPYASARLLNIDYLIAEKWSSQNRTSWTSSTAPELPGFCCCLVFDWQERRRKMRPRGFNNLEVWSCSSVCPGTRVPNIYTKRKTHHLVLWTKNT